MSKEYYTIAAPITPSDTLPNKWDAIYVGGAGNVSVMPDQASAVATFIAPPVGSIIEIKTRLVMATLTTATNLVGLR